MGARGDGAAATRCCGPRSSGPCGRRLDRSGEHEAQRGRKREVGAVVSVVPSTPFQEVAEQLAEHDISGLPVLDEDDRVVGVVSADRSSGAPRPRRGRPRTGPLVRGVHEPDAPCPWGERGNSRGSVGGAAASRMRRSLSATTADDGASSCVPPARRPRAEVGPSDRQLALSWACSNACGARAGNAKGVLGRSQHRWSTGTGLQARVQPFPCRGLGARSRGRVRAGRRHGAQSTYE
ncbi:CBS domain-containing protein [Streptomyces wuyuanensis]|uniref:CBS domain-containing protein n=1 Tax=Streptomyces wuyuanensis TaxID=1196353 RepID=UPI00384E6934